MLGLAAVSGLECEDLEARDALLAQLQAFIDAAGAVVIYAVAYLCSAGVDGGITVVAVARGSG